MGIKIIIKFSVLLSIKYEIIVLLYPINLKLFVLQVKLATERLERTDLF